MNDSGEPLLWLSRSSNGLFASNESGDEDASALIAYPPWNVRLTTSICCSRVSRTKFTA